MEDAAFCPVPLLKISSGCHSCCSRLCFHLSITGHGWHDYWALYPLVDTVNCYCRGAKWCRKMHQKLVLV